MSYIIRIFDGDNVKDIELGNRNTFSIGDRLEDDYVITDPEATQKRVLFEKREGKWHIEGKRNVFFNGESITKNEIKSGDIYTLGVKSKIKLWVYQYTEDFKLLSIDNITSKIYLGRNPKCNITIKDKRVSGNHAVIYKDNKGAWYIKDTNSKNGIFLNGKRIQESVLDSGDEIKLAIYTIKITKTHFVIIGGDEKIEVKNVEMTSSNDSGEEIRNKRKYPSFNMSPRLRKKIPGGEIEIDAPPSVGMKPDVNWLSVLLPPMAMIAIMLTVVLVTDGNTMSLYYTIPMSLVSILVAITTYFAQKKKHENREKVRLEKYEEYMQNKVSEIEEKQNLQMDALTLQYPSIKECFDMVCGVERRLWERQVHDDDFMSVCLGHGIIDFSMSIRVPKESVTIEEDALKTKPKEIREKYKKITNAPISLNLAESVTCGIVGDRSASLKILKNIVSQITALHSYNDVKLVTVYSKEEANDFEWIKWLPHSFDDDRNTRYMADDDFSAIKLFNKMEDILSARANEFKEDSSDKAERKTPHYLFIISKKEMIEDQSIIRYLTSNNPNFSVSTIFTFDELGKLPRECNIIIEADGNTGNVFNKENVSEGSNFSIDDVRNFDFENYARKMMPIRIEAGIEEKLLPNCVTFLEGYGVRTPEEINLEANWNSALTYKSMSVPIGVKVNGEDFYFDIHEKKYGPHGLVAGMTGSGKSEMVQSWILSMALKFSPEDVSFVLIDFKGTGLILPFLNMPHLAGTISDLDTNINRNLIALENELSRRKALLDEAGVNNINAYMKAYKDGKVKEPLSFLFVVIDEFAEFKVQFPDFMTVINRIFAIGRTLGVFAILLTQKPSGVVDDKMNANTRFRWCLKVASSADSKDMLKHSDAAKITTPGRAYIQVGEDEVYELVQSYWSGAPYDPNKKRTSSIKPTISIVGIDGERTEIVSQRDDARVMSEMNEIDAIVKYLDEYVDDKQLKRARKIWEPKMPSYVPLLDVIGEAFNGKVWPENQDDLSPVIGLADNPHIQKQYPLRLNISGDGHIAIYGAPGTGKTTFLHTLIMSTCMSYKPEDVFIYAMDFGGWSLNIFRDYPHVGGIANDNDAEKVDKLAKLISKEIEERKYKFAEAGVGNINAYRETSGEKIPYILLLVDNFAPVLNLYPDLEDFFVKLTREGGNYGVYLVVTANNTMSLGFKLSQNIKMAFTLQMTDRTDYAAIVGKTNGLEPDNNEGRGLVKGTPPLEFQTALPVAESSETEKIQKIKAIGNMMNNVWFGKRAKPIPIMPELIPFGSLDSKKTVIGLSVKDIEPVACNYESIHYIAVSGKPGSGRSNMLQCIAKQRSPYKLFVYDSSDKGLNDLQDKCDLYVENGQDFDELIAKLIPLLQERRDLYLQNSEQQFNEILILIDDLKECFDAISDETARRLDAIVRLGKGLNVNLLVAGNSDDFRKLSSMGESFTNGLVNGPISILLGGSYSDHNCFKTNIPYSLVNETVGDTEGYYVEREKATRFKAMYCK